MKYHNKILFIASAGVLFLLPIIYWRGFLFGYTFTKTIFFITAVELMSVFWLLSAWPKIKHRGKSAISGFVLLLFAVMLVSSVFGEDLSQSIWSNYERMMGLWTIFHIILWYFILATTLKNDDSFVWLVRIIVFSASIVSAVGFYEMIRAGGATRIGSTFNNSAFLASYLLLAAFFSIWLFLRMQKIKIAAVLWFITTIFIISVLIFTGTRGAIIAFGFGVFVLMGLFLAFGPRNGAVLSIKYSIVRKLAWAGLICFVLAGTAGFLFREQLAGSSFDPLKRLASISFESRTVVGRLSGWRVAWAGIQDHLVLGWGVENFNLLFNSHYSIELYEQEPWFDRAHNFIFDTWSTIGLVGLIAYLGIFAAAFYSLASGFKSGIVHFWTFAVFSALLSAHFIQNMFVFDAITSLVLLFTVFAFIHIVTRRDTEELPFFGYPKLRYLLFIVAAVLPIWYMGVWRPTSENYFGKLGYDAFARGNDKQGMEYVEKALDYDTYGDVDVRRGVAEYLFDFLKKGGKRNPDDLKSVINYAIEKVGDNIKEKPKDVKWYMYQGELYNLKAVMFDTLDLASAKKAEGRFMEAQKFSGERMQVYLEIAQARKVLGDYSGMWEAVDRAIRLVPQSPLPHYNALAHAVNVKNKDRETEELDWLYSFQDGNVDYDTIRDIYYAAELYSKAADVQKRYIDFQFSKGEGNYSKKDIAQMYTKLALLYKMAGNYDKARGAAVMVGKLDPQLQGEADVFLRSLE